MRTVLVPFDFSPYAQRGLRLALSGIPFGPEVQIEVLHVIDRGLYDHVLPHRPRPSIDTMRAHVDDAVEKARAELDTPLDVMVTTTVVEGDPFEEITKRAATSGGIILGGQGHGGLREKVLGRTANRLADKINVPTYIVKTLEEHSVFVAVLCAVDFSTGAKTVLHAARDLSRAIGVELVTAHIVDPLPPDLTAFDRKLQRENVEAARKKLIAEEQAAFGEVLSTAQLCFVGSSVRKIVDVAQLYDASCIVVGRNSQASFAHAVLGSVASRLLHVAATDLLVVPLG